MCWVTGGCCSPQVVLVLVGDIVGKGMVGPDILEVFSKFNDSVIVRWMCSAALQAWG